MQHLNKQQAQFIEKLLAKEESQLPALNEEQLSELQKDLDAIRDEVRADLGQRDADYIRRIYRIHRTCEIAGRVMMPLGFIPPFFVAGVLSLSLAKILDNMEIGHNVMHGQYDWMNDPLINGPKYEWDTVCDADSWRHYHNFEHHHYTNVIGMDRDYGYTVMRLNDDIPWRPANLLNLVNLAVLTVVFQWGVGLHDYEVERVIDGRKTMAQQMPVINRFTRKMSRQTFKDYVFYPALTLPVAPVVIAGNMTANFIRNVWAGTVIFMGHFTEGAETFDKSCLENESKGHWYLRQLTGSANFTGPVWMHILSGHLSHQIEHHLFPDMPAHRYREIAPRIEAIAAKYGLPYSKGTFAHQYGTVVKRVAKYSLPAKWRNKLLGALQK